MALDPGNPRFRSAGITYVCLGKYEKAIQAFNLDRGSSLALLRIGMIFYRREENQKAIETWNELLAQEPTGVFSLFGTAMKALLEGENETARTAMTELEQANPVDAEIWFSVAEIYGLLGDALSSARTLEEGVNRGYFNYPFMVSDSFFDQVRSAPEFQGVLEMQSPGHGPIIIATLGPPGRAGASCRDSRPSGR